MDLEPNPLGSSFFLSPLINIVPCIIYVVGIKIISEDPFIRGLDDVMQVSCLQWLHIQFCMYHEQRLLPYSQI